MDLKDLEKNWDAFGKSDPLWAILTLPEKRNRAWRVDEFFQTGVQEIDRLMKYAHSIGRPAERRRALDFGCGVGRLTQALCRHFAYCEGIDIAPSMIELAEKYNQYGDRCRYHLNRADDLRLFEDGRFDLIYSSYVLQHMRPEYSKGYIQEFIRTLAPGGLLVFQLTSERITGSTAPLPETAFRAQIKVQKNSLIARAGEMVALAVSVKNLSPVRWPALGDAEGRYCVRLGNHWLNERGDLLQNDDGRAVLPRDIEPMAETELPLLITIPPEPGNYLLEVDLVEEGVAWFQTRGSATIRIPVLVKTPFGNLFFRRKRKNTTDLSTPQMEMYGVPREAVQEWVEEARGTLADVVEIFATGKEFLDKDWKSYCYCVTR